MKCGYIRQSFIVHRHRVARHHHNPEIGDGIAGGAVFLCVVADHSRFRNLGAGVDEGRRMRLLRPILTLGIRIEY